MSTSTNLPNPASTDSCCSPRRSSADKAAWSYTPPMDVYETSDAYVIECDTPGLNPAAIDLTYDAGILRLHAQAPQRRPADAGYLRQEYGVGDFDRDIPLGRLAEFVDGEQLNAEYAGGVLTIRLPKLAFAQPRRINVKTANS